MSDDLLKPPVGASVWELELFEHLTHHVQMEEQLLEGYLAAAETTDSKALAYIIGLLVEDERRHHRQFNDLAASLKSSAELSRDEPTVPYLDFRSADRDAALALTRELIAGEEKDRDEMKRLRKDLRDLADTTLWSMLVDTMLLDTEKHLTMLRFVEKHTK